MVTIWEHEFDKNKEMKSIKLDVVEPPKIRNDGFHGGRCEPLKLVYDFKSKGVKGKYIDVVSLYPTVMYYDRSPRSPRKDIEARTVRYELVRTRLL